jgi:hypothetical protein
MLLVAEQYAAPYDLLAEALAVPPARVRAITARWRGAGYVVTGVLGPGPAWCWLTPQGMAATGHTWPARRRCRAWPMSARSSPPGCGSRRSPPTPPPGHGGGANGRSAPASRPQGRDAARG